MSSTIRRRASGTPGIRTGTGPGTAGRARALRSRVARRFAGCVAVAALIAACTGGAQDPSNRVATLPSVAPSADASGGPAASGPVASVAPTDGYERALAYAQCMRSHGVAAFPDPVNDNGNVGFQINAGPGTGIQPDSPQFKAAEDACKQFAPVARTGGNDQIDQQSRDAALAYSKCMRENGVPDFPDPKFEGNGMSLMLPKGLNPNSAQFKAAEDACASLRPGVDGPKGGGSDQGGSTTQSGGTTGGQP